VLEFSADIYQTECAAVLIYAPKSLLMLCYQKNPVTFINIFDGFLLITVSEGMTMTLLESMNIGLPCIVTNLGGNTEVCAHEQTGFVLGTHNLAQQTKAVGSLANSPAKTKAFSEAVVAVFNEKFTQQQMNQQYQRCYTSAFKK